MDGERKNDWLGLLALTAAGMLLFSSVYYGKLWASRPETYSADPGREKIILALGEEVQIDAEKIVYKGLAEGGRFTMAVVLLNMDPEYSYIHEIGIREAKDGFSLVGHRFELISASRSKVRFWHIKESAVLALNDPGDFPVAPKPWLGPRNAWGP
ncbi:MAG: hypothetical protein PVG78_15910 [Desulfobacterales bacterium]